MTGGQYALLVEAAESSLPMTLEDGPRIDQLRAYQSAGWVEASIPPLVPGPNGTLSQPPATLLALTSAGRRIAEQARGGVKGLRRVARGRTSLMRGC